jgi:hypothetical protein
LKKALFLGLSFMIGGCVVLPMPTPTIAPTPAAIPTRAAPLSPEPTGTPEAWGSKSMFPTQAPVRYTYEVGVCVLWSLDHNPASCSASGVRYDMPQGKNTVQAQTEYNASMPAYCRISDGDRVVDFQIQQEGQNFVTCSAP